MNTLYTELEKLENHDCHLSEDSGCETCERIAEIKSLIKADEAKKSLELALAVWLVDMHKEKSFEAMQLILEKIEKEYEIYKASDNEELCENLQYVWDYVKSEIIKN